MSFREVERSLEKLQDITEAPKLRKENKQLLLKLANKEKEYQEREAELHVRIQELRAIVDIKDREIQKFKARRIKYKKKYTDEQFEALVESRFTEDVRKDIVEEAYELYKRRLPMLIEAEIRKYPHNCSPATHETIDKRGRELRDAMLNNPQQWSPSFKAKVNEEANQRAHQLMDHEFDNRVLQASESRLSHLINQEWPRYLRMKFTPFLQSTFQSQLRRMQMTVQVICWKCDGEIQITLTPDDFASIIQRGVIWVNCVYCKHFLRPTHIKIYLGDLIWMILNNGYLEPPPKFIGRQITYKKINNGTK